MLLFLNELSCAEDTDETAVDEGMREFVGVVRHVRKRRADTGLVTVSPLSELELAPGYYLRQWIDKPGNRDRWRYLQSTRNRSPIGSVLPSDPVGDVDYTHGDRRAHGLGGAHLVDGLAVSLPVAAQWRSSWIKVDRTRLIEDGNGEDPLVNDTVDVRHAWCRDEIDCHDEWIATTGLSGVTSGTDLWEARGDFFPHLRFLPRVEHNLRDLQVSWLRPVRDRLLELETAIAEWDPAQSPEPKWRSYITPESDGRQHLCKFDDLDGETRVFDMHARFSPSPGRLHFRLVPEDGTATVAHIGRKLGV